VLTPRIIGQFAVEDVMPASPRSENKDIRTHELRSGAPSWPTFDRDLAAKIGNRVALRRSFCRLSKHQLGARLGIEAADVSAHEQGEKRMSCKLLFETAKQLKAAPRFFFE
jgi:hypothetical protein